MPCPGGRCPVIESVYATYAPYIGRHCNRFADVPQCDVLVPSRLPCGCPTFVSRESALLPWLAEWQELACDNDISCEPCPAPVGGACTEDAFCIDQY
jgi:hypothetical protein